MKFRVASITELSEKSVLGVRAGFTRIVLCRLTDGTITALHDRCSHAQVRLSGGRLVGDELECPAHRARFDCRTGAAICGPAVVGVCHHEVMIEGDYIFVNVP
jgi:3-phenylpropionate/trans-cinnamate dioxygenase ferredoxin subunit